MRICSYHMCNDNEIIVRLLCSQGKVAPINPTSIPRLQLCGAISKESMYTQCTVSDLPEVKNNQHIHHSVHQQINWFPFHRFSQFNRTVRACTYMLRFIHNVKNKNNKRSGPLTVEELNESLSKLTHFSQMESFEDVFNSINKHGELEKSHNLTNLNPFLDANKLIRVGGRLNNSTEFSYNKKHPILISGKHHVTLLLFRADHKRLLHAAPQALLYAIRETYWPVGGRDIAKNTIYNCVTCSRFRAKTLTSIMGNLPMQRLRIYIHAHRG